MQLRFIGIFFTTILLFIMEPQPTVLVFGNAITQDNIDRILNCIKQNGNLLVQNKWWNINYFFSHNRNWNLKNYLVIIISHGCLSINEESGMPSYFLPLTMVY